MLPEDVDALQSRYPGFVDQAIKGASSYVNDRLRKRYDVPLGKAPPPLLASGTAPPPVLLTGRPVLGSVEIEIQITTGGALGAALFRWCADGGLTAPGSDLSTWIEGVPTAPVVVLGATGLSALFSPGAFGYGIDNQYSAATPVPSAVLDWIAAIATVRVFARRGGDPSDLYLVGAKERYDQTIAELKEAADSDVGLFDLAPSEDVAGSAIAEGGPQAYSEASPYVPFDLQRATASFEDENGRGSP